MQGSEAPPNYYRPDYMPASRAMDAPGALTRRPIEFGRTDWRAQALDARLEMIERGLAQMELIRYRAFGGLIH